MSGELSDEGREYVTTVLLASVPKVAIKVGHEARPLSRREMMSLMIEELT